ncbi:MAG: AMP-binding protein [Acidobacteriota bacterium]|nr:AMP-binding protein [Acidobacteriota bacterium]
MVRETLVDFFRDLARSRGEFLVYDDGYRTRRHTYREVGAAARGFAARLQAAGLAKGDKVIFWGENRPEWLVALWGCLLTGIVAVPIDYRASASFLERVRAIVEARIVLVGDDVPPPAAGGLHTFAGAETWRFAELAWEDGPVPPVALTRDDVAEIIFTSGATAEPKGVVITHRNILANIVPIEREVRKYRKFGRPFFPLRFLNLLPLSHMFGQAMATFVPPMLPGTVVFTRGYNPAEIVDQIRSRRVSVLVSVPKILDVLREHLLRVEPGARGPREAPEGREAEPSRRARARGGGAPRAVEHVARRWWRYRRVHRLFGLKFWSFVVGAAPLETELEQFWSRLGFLVIQGYGLTETAPIVSLNHPLFGTRQGSVGKAIGGVEVRIADDGEILVRGDNVTSGYFHADEETRRAFEDGWFHTGDIGELDDQGRLFIRGRKKEMIVTPEGLNVFPEDVERVLNALPGVRESAVVGLAVGGEERVHAVLVLEPGTGPDAVDRIVQQANAQLEDHQKVRRALAWPGDALPRTEGTRKLKRAAIKQWVATGGLPAAAPVGEPRSLEALLAKYAGGRTLSPGTTIEELGLSSLERVELMSALEDAFQTRLDEGIFTGARSIDDLRKMVEEPGAAAAAAAPEVIEFPSWNQRAIPRLVRRANLAVWLLPLTRAFAWLTVEGREHLAALDGPVIFAANHQSYMDAPVVLAALPRPWRYRVATAMAKEFFKPHFFPAQYGRRAWFTNSLNYWLAAGLFNAFPLPQREAGARQTLRYIGEELVSRGQSILIFPEGRRADSDALGPFMPGIGMLASKLEVPVVPVRIEGLHRVLGPGAFMAKPGRVRVTFGPPLRLRGEDYGALARQVQEAVERLGSIADLA